MATHSVNRAVVGHSRLRALIADDQSSVRNEISRVLHDDDSIEIVSECANRNEAIAAIAEHTPDMLFVDVQLLKIRPFPVVAASGGIPAVFFTNALDRYAARAFDAHAADFVVKPFQLEKIASSSGSARNSVYRRSAVAPANQHRRA